MSQSPLIIEEYNLKSFVWNSNPELLEENPDAVPQGFNIDTTVDRNEDDENRWRVGLRVSTMSNNEKSVFSFDISYVGYFQVAEGFPAELSEKLVAVNATSILFAAAREMILLVSGRSLPNAIILPSVSFVEKPGETHEKMPSED